MSIFESRLSIRQNFLIRVVILTSVSCAVNAQEQPNPISLLPDSQIDQLIDEVSGATAMNHVIELGGYNHDRDEAEYLGTYHESEYITGRARQYGLSDVHIETFPLKKWTWDAEDAELWLVKPTRRLIVSYRDVPAALATQSWNADLTSQLVYAGPGTDSTHYENLDVRGKIVLVSGRAARAHLLAVRTFGAAGVLSYYNGTGRPIDRPDQIAWQGLGGRAVRSDGSEYPYEEGFGFSLSHRMAMDLIKLLESAEPVELRARVVTRTFPADMEVPTAAIPGNGSSNQEIVLAAHLFEGIAKQGANDNMSGSAAILEAARALNSLISQGRIARPRRTIRLIWVPEFSGTYAYLERFFEERNRMIAAINIDMIGSHMTQNGNSLRLYRNPNSMASFVDEVTQVFFEYVGDTNREKVHNRSLTYGFMKPILDPTGSRDPFYYNIESYYGSSDHALFNGPRFKVPAVLFNNWPDIGYHTSEDRIGSVDPTQLKRGAFLIAASAWYMANLSPQQVPQLATRMSAMGATRIDREIIGHLSRLTAAPANLVGEWYKDARIFLHQAYLREERSLKSLTTLVEPGSKALRQLAAIVEEMADRESLDQRRLKNHFERLTRDAVIPVKIPGESDDEKIAKNLVPVLAPTAVDTSLSVVVRMRTALGSQIRSTSLRGIRATEVRNLTDGQRSVLDIRNAVSAAFGPVSIRSVLQYFYDLEEQGLVFLRRG
ncbi:MAG: M28 family peptidase [Candidatus Latescibacteria bacterium]|nr:M28 family peptidase [Candidatus Latescibacterota bacterium]